MEFRHTVVDVVDLIGRREGQPSVPLQPAVNGRKPVEH
jgi:hypothetical protein